MARRRPPERLDELARSAIEVFSERGYRRTQMADVAHRLGTSPGALYGYVESKEALFDLAVRRAFGEALGALPLPVRAPEAGELLRHVRAGLRAIRRPSLEASLERPAPRDVAAELTEVLGELYDGLSRNGPALRLLEASARDRPDLAELYFRRGRAGLVERLRAYLERRIREARLRPVPDVAVTARLVLEAVAWFAWHRFGDPAPQPMDDAVARETVIAVLARGLLPPGDTP